MNAGSRWKYAPSFGVLLSLLLIGLVLLSALLYYRAIKIQRFLEPALALSQPRNEFGKKIHSIFQREFGTQPVAGVKVKTSAVLLDKSLLFSGDGALKASARADVRKLARFFLALMQDDQARSEISLVLIIARVPAYGAEGLDAAERAKTRHMVGLIQDALFQSEPELGMRFAPYFTGAVQPTSPHEANRDVVELRIIPSEFLHIEVLEKLEKYSR